MVIFQYISNYDLVCMEYILYMALPLDVNTHAKGLLFFRNVLYYCVHHEELWIFDRIHNRVLYGYNNLIKPSLSALEA